MQSHGINCSENSGYINERVDNRYNSIIQRGVENAPEGYIVFCIGAEVKQKI